MRLRSVFFLAILVATNCLTLRFSDEIKAYLSINYDAYRQAHTTPVYAGVILPDELVSDSESDAELAKSFLSDDVDWVFVAKARMPEFINVKGVGFSFRSEPKKK